MANRINIKDVINEEFYQLPKVFFWNKTYREQLNNGSKLLYMLIRDRFKLSVYTTKEAMNNGDSSPAFVDVKGDIYCILDNCEIEFTLNTTRKTVKKYMDELISCGLVSIESTEGGANRIYLNNPESNGASLATFLGEKDYYEHVQARKKRGKDPVKTLEDCIAYHVDKRELIHKGGKNSPTSPENNNPPSPVKIPPLEGEETPALGGEKVTPNKNYSSDLESSKKDSSSNESNKVISSSSSSDMERVNDDKGIEEEPNKKITIDDHYSSLDFILKEMQLNFDKKGINVIKKTLKDSKIESFSLVDVLKAVATHAINLKKRIEMNDPVKYEPAFFANNLVDRIRENEAIREAKMNQSEQAQTTQLPSYIDLTKDIYAPRH